MDLFLQTALSFPTVVFSVLLAVCLALWLLTLAGLFDLDVFGVSANPDSDVVDFAGFLARFGLDGVPATLIATGFMLFSWVISYFGTFLLLTQFESGSLRLALGIALMLFAFLMSMPLTGLALRPLAPLFAKAPSTDQYSLLLKVATVRSPSVDETRGTADLNDGGAGLVLQIRAPAGHFARGDHVVLTEYVESQNAYRVIASSARPPAAD